MINAVNFDLLLRRALAMYCAEVSGMLDALTCIANDGKGKHGPNQRIGIRLADEITGPWKPASGIR